MFILRIILISLLSIYIPVGSVWAQFGTEAPYEEAVPSFLETITQSVEDILDSQQLEDISVWHDANMSRLDEFLDDLLLIAQDLENNNDPDFVFTAYQGFVDKWDDVAGTFPHLDEIAPTMAMHIDELFENFPKMEPKAYPIEANPMAPLADFYNEAEQGNPWGLGSFWNDDLLVTGETVTTRTETSTESTSGGVLQEQVVSEDAVITNNGEVVYSENIQGGNIIDRFVKYRPPTFMHEALDGAIHDGVDPDIINWLQETVGFMDDGLLEANQAEVLDDCSYSFIQRGTQMELVSECTDIENNEQDFGDMLDSDPFDWIKRPFLGFNK